MTKSETGIVIIDPSCELSDDVYEKLDSQIDWDVLKANGTPITMMPRHKKNGGNCCVSNKTENSSEEDEIWGIMLTGEAFIKIFGGE